ncbi:MAG: hypothetical protein HS130_00815 [Deltaproteobacteria bacterium]|nr:hypothetical protein [Deltaproteobacteria bacterium]MCL4873870.1 hypothetical protein [bacterium]
MIKPLYITQHDLRPYYPVRVKDHEGNGVDLTGYTIRCTMVPAAGGTAKINRRTAGITLGNQSTSPGLCHLKWQAGDTDTIGTFNIEFEFTLGADSDKFTYPSPEHGPAQVIVGAGLDDE